MKRKIGIEDDLEPVKEYLTNKGYEVKNIDFAEDTSKLTNKFDAFVVTGINSNMMGIHDTSTKAVIIDAAGMSPEQVYHELESRLEQ
ncbi:MAG: YkuS family protein [Bacillota bacterium]